MSKRSKLKNLLEKWGIKTPPIKDNKVEEIKTIIKEKLSTKKLKEVLAKLAELTNLVNSSKEITDKELSDLSNQLTQTQVDFVKLVDEKQGVLQALLQDLQETKAQDFKKEITEVAKDITDLEDEIKKEIGKLRVDLLKFASREGGGAQNQKISINGSVMSTKYADFNLKGSITKADNDTTKAVDITIADAGIGGTVTGGNDNSVLFIDPANILAQDVNFTFDNNTDQLAVGGSIVTPTVYGGTAANDDLTLRGTSNATQTTSYVFINPGGGGVMIGSSTAPSQNLVVSAAGSVANFEIFIGSGIVMQSFNRTTSAYGSYSYDGSAHKFRVASVAGNAFQFSWVNAQTLTSASVGIALDMSTNLTPASQSITGQLTTLPTVTAASTNTYKGQSVTMAALTSTGAGASTFVGYDLQMPAITQTAGTLTSIGLRILGGAVTSGTSIAISTDAAAGVINLGAKIGQYNAITTTGWGTPAIYGTGRSTAQTAAVATVATYTVGGADGSFLVTSNVNVTTSTAHNFAVQVDYTDETNTARTLTLAFYQLAGTQIVAITNVTGAGPYEGSPAHIRCKASTAITIKTTGTFTTVTYNVEGSIIQLS